MYILTLAPQQPLLATAPQFHVSCSVFLSPYLFLFPSLFPWLSLCLFSVQMMVPVKLQVKPSPLLTHYQEVKHIPYNTLLMHILRSESDG